MRLFTREISVSRNDVPTKAQAFLALPPRALAPPALSLSPAPALVPLPASGEPARVARARVSSALALGPRCVTYWCQHHPSETLGPTPECLASPRATQLEQLSRHSSRPSPPAATPVAGTYPWPGWHGRECVPAPPRARRQVPACATVAHTVTLGRETARARHEPHATPRTRPWPRSARLP